jgi:hypothetical protein
MAFKFIPAVNEIYLFDPLRIIAYIDCVTYGDMAENNWHAVTADIKIRFVITYSTF